MEYQSSDALKAGIRQKLLRKSQEEITEGLLGEIFDDMTDTMEGLRKEIWQGTLAGDDNTEITHARGSIYFNYSVLWLDPVTGAYRKIEVIERSRTNTNFVVYIGEEKENCLIVIT